MAVLSGSEGNFAEAEKFSARALQIYEQLSPLNHPDLIAALENRAYILDRLGRSPEASDLRERARQMRARHAAAKSSSLSPVRNCAPKRVAPVPPLAIIAVFRASRPMIAFIYTIFSQIHASNLRRLWEDWKGDWEGFVRKDFPKIALVIVVAAVLLKLLGMATGRLAKIGRKETLPTGMRAQQLRTLATVLNSVGAAMIFFLATMQILPLLGVNMGPLLASAGVAGVAIGFGAQTLVRDVINGFFILMENQYDIGDTVRLAGVSGTVESMTLRRTMLRDVDGTVHFVPNSEIKIVSNLTRDWAQVILHISVGYGENSDRVIALLKAIANETRSDPEWKDRLVADIEVPGIERVAGGEVDYLMLAKTYPGQQYAVSRELRRRIKECFEKNHIQPGSPARVYVLDQASGAAK